MATIHLSKSEFETKVATYDAATRQWSSVAERPVLIDFFATWCGPCKALSPVLEEVSADYAGRVDIYKVDVDEEPELARMWGIRSVPTLIYLPLNGEARMSQGFLSREHLRESIDKILMNG